MELTTLSRPLEHRIAQQLREIEPVDGPKRFRATQIAELVLSLGTDEPLHESHQRTVAMLLCEPRGWSPSSVNIIYARGC